LGAASGRPIFGRSRYDVLNDDMHRWIGAEATSSIGLRPSQFQLTDNERLLRDPCLPPDRAAAFRAPAVEERVRQTISRFPSPWRQQVVFRPHRLWAAC